MATLKELAQRPELFTNGHRACAGCGFPQAIRLVLKASDRPVVVVGATGCMEVTSTIYPYTAWDCSFMHNAFENAASTLSGIEAAYQALRRSGRLKEEFHCVAFAGDGGTYDIGLQALSGAMERGHDMLYVCYDNGAYANTGIQRSGATPRGSNTTTSPVGTRQDGKTQKRKDLTAIMAAHDIPYVAQGSIAHWRDLVYKAKKGMEVEGPAFLNVMAPCRLSWATPPEDTVDLVKHAVDCCFWPLFEVEQGRWKINYRPKEKKSYIDWLKRQGRFKHLFRGDQDDLLQELESEVEASWQRLLRQADEIQ